MKWVDDDFYRDIEEGSPSYGMAFLGIAVAGLILVAIVVFL